MSLPFYCHFPSASKLQCVAISHFPSLISPAVLIRKAMFLPGDQAGCKQVLLGHSATCRKPKRAPQRLDSRHDPHTSTCPRGFPAASAHTTTVGCLLTPWVRDDRPHALGTTLKSAAVISTAPKTQLRAGRCTSFAAGPGMARC